MLVERPVVESFDAIDVRGVTFAMPLAFFPLALVAAPIGELSNARAFESAQAPEAPEHRAVWNNEVTIAVAFAVFPLAFVDAYLVSHDISSFAVQLIIEPVALIERSILLY